MATVMIDMALDDEDMADMVCPIPIDVKDRPKYPYGLCITLTDAQFRKFKEAGIDFDHDECFVGGIIHFHALGRITSCSQSESADGKQNCRVEIQIEDMAIESEDRENEED